METNLLTLLAQSHLFWIFTHLKLYLADAGHSFKWVKIFGFGNMEAARFQTSLNEDTFKM